MTRDTDRSADRTPGRDWALGPGSVSWTIMRDPTVFFVGLLREAILLTLHPPFAAAAVDHDSFLDDPINRFRHIAMYAYGATYGTAADAERVSAMVRHRHLQIVGVEPLSGERYQAHAEYELALTQTMLTASFLAAYETLHGPLSSARRDQFLCEQKVPGALLGVPPENLPSTWGAQEDFLSRARDGFATGYQAREILQPFSRATYPEGSAIGELPWPQRAPVMWVIRSLADMAMLTMNQEERSLVAIDRSRKLRSDVAVKASFRLLSRFMRSRRGRKAFEEFVGPATSKIMRRAFAVDDQRGKRARSKAFRVPDASEFVVHLPDLVHNWPEAEKERGVPAPASLPVPRPNGIRPAPNRAPNHLRGAAG